MKAPDTPADEQARLRALRSLSILDTPAEERFDRLTRLSKRIFNMPIALITLVDATRQWFKSSVGLDVRETPRDISFCGHAILGDDAFVINDAVRDERFNDNPLVVNAPHIRFYAGVPLCHVDGSKLGTLCVIDTVPRTLSDDELRTLHDFAKLAEAELVAIHLATLDDLTKIMNKTGFLALAQNSLNICSRQKIPATLVFLDLNDFKAVNDQFGHIEGDSALIAFAAQLTRTFRDSDIIARFGGDEFVVLLTDASRELTTEIIERFRRSLDAHCETQKLGYKISFSDGMIEINPDEDSTIKDLLMRADAAMYEGKRVRPGVRDEP